MSCCPMSKPVHLESLQIIRTFRSGVAAPTSSGASVDIPRCPTAKDVLDASCFDAARRSMIFQAMGGDASKIVSIDPEALLAPAPRPTTIREMMEGDFWSRDKIDASDLEAEIMRLLEMEVPGVSEWMSPRRRLN